ncbi:MAG: YkgJ family cysteine cluster protein [Lentisphaeria bacterium]|nr:YkgJ family cysteine cluster protein [Lentisphaeria bacterium]
MEISKFKCVRCGTCCKWEGAVRVTEQEIDAIAAFLGIPLDEFIQKHTYLTPDRKSLSLLEKPDGSCCYYDDDAHACRIQPVKPAQCSAFPYEWNFPGWEKLCKGAQQDEEE